MKNNEYLSYPPEAKQEAISLFKSGLGLREVVAVMRNTYPRIARQTISSWAIQDEDFGVIYRNGIASSAQTTVVASLEQLDNVYSETEALVSIMKAPTEDTPKIDPNVLTGLRLMKDVSKDQLTGAMLLLSKTNKNYRDNIKTTHEFENLPTIQLEVVDSGVSNP